MSDYVISLIRTGVGLVVGALVAWLVGLGVLDDSSSATVSASLIAAIVVVVQGAWYAFARWAEDRWPGLPWFLIRKTPTYGDGMAD